MELHKIPFMTKEEYDSLIKDGYVSRIAFKGQYPYIAPFLYVFDGSFLYFLSTKYGKKVKLLNQDPQVAVEIECYQSDLSEFRFVTLQGTINSVAEEDEKKKVRGMFVDLIKGKELSTQILAALGHSPEEPLEKICQEERSYVWKLVDVQDIIALKS
jgi:nitroimidazol reductase NimA-like FMN-containing flavoprotein (pyridoxamine 5'-phosphate oxidase superfamily)